MEMRELDRLEIEQVAGGLDWWKGERSTNVFYTDGNGFVWRSNVWGGWSAVYLP
jgi:hypothetical protein